jgi:hypothetical protein
MAMMKRSWKVFAGSLLAVAGALSILIAWLRVRDLLEVADQVPIIISGGMGGVALVAGGIWLLRSHETDLLMAHMREAAERLERVEEDVSQLTTLFDGARVEVEPTSAGPRG